MEKKKKISKKELEAVKAAKEKIVKNDKPVHK